MKTDGFYLLIKQRLPHELFQEMPTGIIWKIVDATVVDGLDTPFAFACLPTGSASDSVMLMIVLLDGNEQLHSLSIHIRMPIIRYFHFTHRRSAAG